MKRGFTPRGFATSNLSIMTVNDIKSMLSYYANRSWHIGFDKEGVTHIYLHSHDHVRCSAALEQRMADTIRDSVQIHKQTWWARLQMAWHNLRG